MTMDRIKLKKVKRKIIRERCSKFKKYNICRWSETRNEWPGTETDGKNIREGKYIKISTIKKIISSYLSKNIDVHSFSLSFST